MSAYNNARYNLAPYNVERENEVWVEGVSSTSFSFSFAGQTFNCIGNSRLAFTASDLTVDKGRVFRGVASEVFESENNVIGYLNLSGSGDEIIMADTLNLSQQAFAVGNFYEIFDESNLNVSQQAFAIGDAPIIFDSISNLSQKAWGSSDLGEVFTATADIIALSEFVCEFPGLTLKPGQTLVVDANIYSILLDNQNAIYLQKGDWLDGMNRNTQSITISGTGASRLTAEILYTERFL